ncbi:hypothetical protein [Zhongshania sp.]|uniref:hypothetical protein n=1 Tax=Zhongshania sp. TaxID=1971902 RepID=UPI003568EF31
MADLGGPDYELRRAEIEQQIAQQELNKKSARVRLMQIESEKSKILTNVEASDKQIKKLEENLEKLISTKDSK